MDWIFIPPQTPGLYLYSPGPAMPPDRYDRSVFMVMVASIGCEMYQGTGTGEFKRVQDFITPGAVPAWYGPMAQSIYEYNPCQASIPSLPEDRHAPA